MIIEAVDFQPLTMEVIHEITAVSLMTIDDEIVECNEIVKLHFVHLFLPFVDFIESQGEFIRDTAMVEIIIDNDCEYRLFMCFIESQTCMSIFYSGCGS